MTANSVALPPIPLLIGTKINSSGSSTITFCNYNNGSTTTPTLTPITDSPPTCDSTTYGQQYIQNGIPKICLPQGLMPIQLDLLAQKCAIQNGTLVTEGIEEMCVIPGNQCPNTMIQLRKWSTTIPKTGDGGSTTSCAGAAKDYRYCTTLSHSLSDQEPETCQADKVAACGGVDMGLFYIPAQYSGTKTITATTTSVGCVLP